MKPIRKKKRGGKEIGGDPWLVLALIIGVALKKFLLFSIHQSKSTSLPIDIDLHSQLLRRSQPYILLTDGVGRKEHKSLFLLNGIQIVLLQNVDNCIDNCALRWKIVLLVAVGVV